MLSVIEETFRPCTENSADYNGSNAGQEVKVHEYEEQHIELMTKPQVRCILLDWHTALHYGLFCHLDVQADLDEFEVPGGGQKQQTSSNLQDSEGSLEVYKVGIGELLIVSTSSSHIILGMNCSCFSSSGPYEKVDEHLELN